jgi:dethiobiotin synthetase
MHPQRRQGYYVTGTDTAVGKTFACVALLHALRAGGRTAVGMKPVASGCMVTSEGLRNDDAMALQAASSPVPAYELVNPFALPEPTAPQIAAALAGVNVSLPPMLAAYQSLALLADTVVVEGVGGWLAPFANGLEQSRFAAAAGLPVILVVGLRLGCLSHARLSERAIVEDGLALAGWIGSAVDPDFAHASEYQGLLCRELSAPCLGLLAHVPDGDASRAAATLRLPQA